MVSEPSYHMSEMPGMGNNKVILNVNIQASVVGCVFCQGDAWECRCWLQVRIGECFVMVLLIRRSSILSAGKGV